MKKKPNLLGPWGEARAADYLRKKGYEIVGANYRCRFGEIDLIAQKGRYLVFVEVKLRAGSNFAEAREYVDHRKQERLRSAALLYLSQRETDLQPRFDVVEIYAPQGLDTKRPTYNHLENAF